MEYNIPEWTEDILGRRFTIHEWVNDPEAQELVAGYLFTKRIEAYGVTDAISLWFTGKPYAGNNACDVNMCNKEYVSAALSHAL